MCVGQAIVQGASKQNRQRAASTAACRGVMRGEISAKFFSYCSGESLGAVSRSVMSLPSFPWLERDAILALEIGANVAGFAKTLLVISMGR